MESLSYLAALDRHITTNRRANERFRGGHRELFHIIASDQRSSNEHKFHIRNVPTNASPNSPIAIRT
ncbi:hypothetical protein AG1IA_10488 [Rhizoctonia solani AG-1 IA]|uniref:Uncharacterized protein n=1 Tax=Thanatephorus cucumeris (strain AG1-IA) TaxID=983506 RepID=L8WFJ4_THACA|nr:hypothetical protein AG1IA_10488 [Rhizoctonia solani AG-1 IA]